MAFLPLSTLPGGPPVGLCVGRAERSPPARLTRSSRLRHRPPDVRAAAAAAAASAHDPADAAAVSGGLPSPPMVAATAADPAVAAAAAAVVASATGPPPEDAAGVYTGPPLFVSPPPGVSPPAHPVIPTPPSREGAATFLTHYWQRRPVLLRDVLPFTPPLTPATLAGLAVEPGVAARVVTYAATSDDDGGDGGGTYTLVADAEGIPAALDAFPDAGGSLLVAGCEALVPPLAGGLLGSWAGLVGGWRTGDVMVSYGSAGGTVGPHVDSYDVFLVAGAGTREWRVAYEPIPDGAEVEVPHCPLRVLAGPGGGVFSEPRGARWVSYVVQPGDVVYVPRRHAHWGVSVGAAGGMTYSVGLRAPSAADVARAYVADVADGLCGAVGVADPVAAMVAALTAGWTAATTAAAAAPMAAAADATARMPVGAGGGAPATTAVDELGAPVLDALWASTVSAIASRGRAGFDDWARRELTMPKGELEEVPPAEWDEMDAGAARDAAVAAAMEALLVGEDGSGDGDAGDSARGGRVATLVGIRRRIGSVLAYATTRDGDRGGGGGVGATLYANGVAYAAASPKAAATAAGMWRVATGDAADTARFVATVGRDLAEALVAAGVWVFVSTDEAEWDGEEAEEEDDQEDEWEELEEWDGDDDDDDDDDEGGGGGEGTREWAGETLWEEAEGRSSGQPPLRGPPPA